MWRTSHNNCVWQNITAYCVGLHVVSSQFVKVKLVSLHTRVILVSLSTLLSNVVSDRQILNPRLWRQKRQIRASPVSTHMDEYTCMLFFLKVPTGPLRGETWHRRPSEMKQKKNTGEKQAQWKSHKEKAPNIHKLFS